MTSGKSWLLAVLTIVVSTASITSTASATTLTSPEGSTYTGTFELESEGSTTFTSSSFATIHCEEMAMSGKVETHGSKPVAGGKVSTITFDSCTDEITAESGGYLAFDSNGTVTSSGVQWTLHTSFGECTLGTSNTPFGTLTNSSAGGEATLHIQSVSIPVVEGSFFCPSSYVWEGSFVVNTPSTLYID